MSLSGKGRRLKGGAGQREVAALLSELYPEAHSGYWQHNGGDKCADVEGTPYFIEVKRGDQTPQSALKQAKTNTDGRTPIAFTRQDHEKWLVTMEAKDWLSLLKLLMGRDQQ